MSISKIGAFFVVFLLSACAGQDLEQVHTAKDQAVKAEEAISPPKSAKSKREARPALHFVCKDGNAFSIVFLKGRKAVLLFKDGKREILKDNAVATGVEYSGPFHIFKEYQGKTVLEGKGKQVMCFQRKER